MAFLAVMDPPWNVDTGGGGRGAQNHYRLTTVAGIADAVRASGLWVDDGPALVWMWATSLSLTRGAAFDLMSALGLRPCAGFVWAKVDAATPPAFTSPRRPGLGQWSRCEHEHLFLCRRGDVKVPPPADRQRSMIYAPRGRHSEKPEAAWDVIEKTSAGAIGTGLGVEFFARTARPGWVAWGTLNDGDAVTTAGA